MSDLSFILAYVHDCAAGAPGVVGCGPVWQFGAIAAFLVLAVVAFVVLIAVRLRGTPTLAVG